MKRYLFCVFSGVGLASAVFCARASRVVWERDLLLYGQIMIAFGYTILHFKTWILR